MATRILFLDLALERIPELKAPNPKHMGGCQNYGLFWGPYYNTVPII